MAKIVKGEEKAIVIRLRDQNDDPIDLTGASVQVEFAKEDATKLVRRNSTQSFLPAAVTASADTITLSDHGFADDDLVQLTNSGGALPAGLSTLTNYYLIVVDKDTFKLSASAGGSAIDLTGQGTGTHSISGVGVSFSGDAMLGKLSVALSEEASTSLKTGADQTIEVHYTIANVTRIVQLKKALTVEEQAY
jgi:hypothetical protein